MSISIHSETSKDEIETEDAELEELVWSLMSRIGLLSQIQGQISKFIEDNGKADSVASSIVPERADGRILGFIFEYLQWVGMKQTNSVLLSESPVEVDKSMYESREEGPEFRPEIYKLFEDQNVTEGKGSPSRSHNYSRDEFEDSRFTSVSGHQSIKSDNLVDDQVNGNDSEEDESYSSHKQSRHKSVPEEKIIEFVKKPNTTPGIIGPGPAAPNEKSKSEVVVEDPNDDMISFISPGLNTTEFDQIRPHVTLRQRADQNTSSDPFQSPNPTRLSLSTVPMVDSNNRLSFVKASNSLEEILGADRISATEAQVVSGNVTDDNNSTTSKESSKSKNNVQDKSIFLEELSKDSQKLEQKGDTKEPSQASQDEESTSDFMDMLTMEDDTQDASIASDEKGMSSCEHAVSLK